MNLPYMFDEFSHIHIHIWLTGTVVLKRTWPFHSIRNVGIVYPLETIFFSVKVSTDNDVRAQRMHYL